MSDVGWSCFAAMLLASTLLGGHGASAEDRIALVVGNGGYQSLPLLSNPGADAKLIAATLERLDFAVETRVDAPRDELSRTIGEIVERARAAKLLLVYFSGHGVQVDGVNYLVPIDANVNSREDLKSRAVALDDLLRMIEAAGPKVAIVVLDACRDNPLGRSGQAGQATRSLAPGAGLARMAAQRGMLIAYATAPGQVALDGTPGQNSPFAAALARLLVEPGLEIGLMFRKVGEQVRVATAGAQVPWTEAALTGDPVFLVDPPPTAGMDELRAFNVAIAIEEPLARELALTRFVIEHGGSPLRRFADEMRFDLASSRQRRQDQADTLEAALADWQRVLDVRDSLAEPLALSAFIALHGESAWLERARSRREELLAAAPSREPPAGADKLMWPLVKAAFRFEDLETFTTVFSTSDLRATAEAGRDLLAALEQAEVPAAPPLVEPAPLLLPDTVTVYAGTGPALVPIAAAPIEVALLETPRWGTASLAVARSAAGADADGKPLATAVSYQPFQDARDVVDRLSLRLGGEDAPREVAIRLAVHPCDSLAAARFDTQAVTLGLYPNEIAAERAVPACREAVERFPAVARFAFQLGRALEKEGAYDDAARSYEAAAAAGHIAAVTAIGRLWADGHGRTRNRDQAAASFEEAAERGDPTAMNSLAYAYMEGNGRPKDMDRAIFWFRRAAEHGHTYAYNALGQLAEQAGRTDEAFSLWSASAAAGDMYGFNNLGWALENGIGTKVDVKAAISWFEKAAAEGQPNGPINLGLLYRDGRSGVPRDSQRAAFWFAEAARLGQPWGLVHLASLHDAGVLPRPDKALAALLCARATLGEDADAAAEAQKIFARLPREAGIIALQRELIRRGFDAGSPDGQFGPRTRAAIASWQAREPSSARANNSPLQLLSQLVRD